MINNSFNSVSMQGLRFRRYSTNTPKMKPLPEGYFMRKSPLAKDYSEPDRTNCFVKFIKKMFTEVKEIIKASKLD